MSAINKQEFYLYYKNAFIDGLKFIEENPIIDRRDFFEEKFHKNVVAIEKHYLSDVLTISKFGKKPINYSFWFKKGIGMDYVKFESWEKLREFVLSNEDFVTHFSLGKEIEHLEESSRKYRESQFIEEKVSALIDHYIHKFNSKKFNEIRFKSIFDKWFNSIKQKKLNFDIWIPLLFTSIDANNFKLSDSVAIKKIDNNLQISRHLYALDGLQHTGAKSFLISGCSHAIVIKNWYFEGTLKEYSIFPIFARILNHDSFIKDINNVIGSIRIVTGFDLGYYQVFAQPLNWTRGYVARYEKLITTYGNFYPPKYEDYGWNKPTIKINKTDLRKSKDVFKYLSESKNEKIYFAIQKLNSIITREKNEDIIFDTTVALESLLANDSNQEITYRLSTRGAYLCKLFKFENYTPIVIKQALTKLYGFRSAVAHGKTKKEIKKLETVKIDKFDIDLLDFGLKFLRHTIKVMLKNSNFFEYIELEKAVLK
jgi:hypothetical protein